MSCLRARLGLMYMFCARLYCKYHMRRWAAKLQVQTSDWQAAWANACCFFNVTMWCTTTTTTATTTSGRLKLSQDLSLFIQGVA